MNRKDIALTVGGVVATMVLAYLLYRMQQRDAAAAASQANATTEGQTQEYQAEGYGTYDQYAAAIGSIPTTSLTGTTNPTTSVTNSAATADTGATGTSNDSTDTSNLISEILSTFAGSINAQATNPNTVASMIIPTTAGLSSSALNGIPLTAAEASSGVPAFMRTSTSLSSHPVTAHPVLGTGE